MRIIKVRWYGANGSIHYRDMEIPESAQIYMGEDKCGRSVWEGDTLVDEFGNEMIASYLSIPVEKMEKQCYHIREDAPTNRKEVWK